MISFYFIFDINEIQQEIYRKENLTTFDKLVNFMLLPEITGISDN